MYAVYIYCDIIFLGITLENQKRLGQNFTGILRVTWQTPLRTLGALHQTGVNDTEKKPHICDGFVSKTTHRFTSFPADDFRKI